MNYHNIRSTSVIVALALSASCSKQGEEFASTAVQSSAKILYVSTGSCNSGNGLTTYTTTAARTIERFHSLTGASLGTLIDYNSSTAFIAATHPREMVDNGDSLLVISENATAANRMIAKIDKVSGFAQPYYSNATTLSGVLRGLTKDSQGNLIIGKTTAIEKLNSTPVRVPAGANPWINAPAGNCATSTTGMTGVVAMASASSTPGVAGKLIFAHQGATAATNRLGVVLGSGYYAAADCAGGVQISAVTHTKASNLVSQTVAFNAVGTSPTSMVYIATPNSLTTVGKLLVTYSNGQVSNNAAGVYNLNHGIVIWDVSEPSVSAATLSNPVVLYDDTSYLFGASAMVYDADTSVLYVAVAGEKAVANQTTNSVPYNIEKFNLDLSNLASPKLTRLSTAVVGGNNMRCVSDMKLGSL